MSRITEACGPYESLEQFAGTEGHAPRVVEAMNSADRIDEIDRMLFAAGVLVLSAKTSAQRTAADHKITEARVQLDMLRASL